MKFGFFGTALLSRKNRGQIDTFADMLRIHYSAQVVAQPQGGFVQEKEILEAVKSVEDMNLAFIAHAEFERVYPENMKDHFKHMKEMDEYLYTKGIPAIHFIKKHQADIPFTSGPVDYVIVNYKENNKLRTAVSWDVSDNGIGFTGNMMAAKSLASVINKLITDGKVSR